MQHEAALAKAEAQLDEDAAKFDAFLKENDERVQAALRKADAESKAKQEKVCEWASPAPSGLPVQLSLQQGQTHPVACCCSWPS